MISAIHYKSPSNIDLKGRNGKLYSFWLYNFEVDLDKIAKGVKTLYYLAKIKNDEVIEIYNLTITSDLLESFEELRGNPKVKENELHFCSLEDDTNNLQETYEELSYLNFHHLDI